MSQGSFFDAGQSEMIEIMLEAKLQGERVFNEVERELVQIAVVSKVVAEATETMSREALKNAAILQWQAQGLKEVKAQAAEAAGSMAVFGATSAVAGSAWQALTRPTGWAQFAVTIGAVLLAMLPLGLLIASATVELISFTAGLAGFLAISTLVIGAFVGMAAAVFLLGGGLQGIGAADRLATTTDALKAAQQALADFDATHGAARGPTAAQGRAITNAQAAISDFNTQHPWAGVPGALTPAQVTQQSRLERNLANAQAAGGGSGGGLSVSEAQQREDLLLKLEQAQGKYNTALADANSPSGQLIAHLEEMKDVLAEQAKPLATLILQWVDGAIPAITNLGQTVMSWFGQRLPGVLAGISRVVVNLTPDFEKFGKHFGDIMDHMGPIIETLGEQMIRVGLTAITGFIDNLVRLTDWFVKELPTIGPIVSQIFGTLGDIIQWVSKHWSQFTDFISKNWEPTVKNAQQFLKELHDWWGKNGDAVIQFAGNLVDLIGQFNTLMGYWMQLYNFMNGVGLSPTAIIGAINQIFDALQKVLNVARDAWGYIANILNQHLRSPAEDQAAAYNAWVYGGRQGPPPAGYAAAPAPPDAGVHGVGGNAPLATGLPPGKAADDALRSLSGAIGGTIVNASVVVQAVDTNNADLVSRTIARNLAKLIIT